MARSVPALLVAVVLATAWHFAEPRLASSPAAQETRVRAFPKRLVARVAQPLPPPGAVAGDRMRQQLASANALWAGVFAAAGERYTPPGIVHRGGPGCGAKSGAWAGLYCFGSKSIAIDLAQHTSLYGRTGVYVADLLLGYTVAHEVGHHVQNLRWSTSLDQVLREELHADCLSGVWGKAAGLPLPPTWAYGVDADHGTRAQRIRWLSRGWLRARPADCDAIFAGEPL